MSITANARVRLQHFTIIVADKENLTQQYYSLQPIYLINKISSCRVFVQRRYIILYVDDDCDDDHLRWRVQTSVRMIAMFPGLREHCMWETFSASCPADEVIVIRSALYGRMRSGRCLITAKDGGSHVGCKANVIRQADRLCSGRPTCDVPLPEDSFDSVETSCPRGLTVYLEVIYECLPGNYATSSHPPIPNIQCTLPSDVILRRTTFFQPVPLMAM